MPFLSLEMIVVSTLLSIVLSVMVYAIVFARGMSGEFSAVGLYMRAVLVALFITVVDLVAASLTGIGAGLWADFQLGL